MPWMSPHPCRYPGCGTLIRGGSGYCSDHRSQARKREDEARPSPAKRGYGPEWRRRRAAFLEANPYCVEPRGNGKRCGAPSTVCDHVVPLSLGGADDESNWQALCKPCHDGPKQRRDKRGWGTCVECGFQRADANGPHASTCSRRRCGWAGTNGSPVGHARCIECGRCECDHGEHATAYVTARHGG